MSEERLYLEGRQILVELSKELDLKCQQSFYSKKKENVFQNMLYWWKSCIARIGAGIEISIRMDWFHAPSMYHEYGKTLQWRLSLEFLQSEFT